MELNIGSKIKALRLASDLTQEELANRAGLTKGFISQLENEKFQTSISLDSLADILEALGIGLAEFFGEETEEQAIFRVEDRVQVEGTGASSFELLIPGSTNNLMDPILVTLGAGEKLEKRDPHPGEQFGFVLKGTITLILSKKSYKVGRNNCFYFTSNQPHQIVNKSDGEASFLWITSPPQM
ncbi:MAG: cupin domain-containing protein [Candidatus Zixiibacteriota bacterium]